MQVEMWSLDCIKPYQNNPRLNDDAVDPVVQSIREFGFRQPIVVDTDGVIIVGHTRWKAAKKLALAEVPVHVAKDMQPHAVRAYRIADNRTGENAQWDFDLLPIEIGALQDSGFDCGLLGFNTDELAKLIDTGVTEGLTDPDEVPEPPDEAITQPGDLWLLGDHRLLCGDSSKPEDVNRLLGGARIQLVNTVPPYNVKVEPRSKNAIAAGNSSFEAGKEKTKEGPRKMRAKNRPLANDFVSDEEFDRLLTGKPAVLERTGESPIPMKPREENMR
ncbi:ParB N-terminal domain-containing protein [Candidatus Laterigemmans baculatus]|uniref:ParB N-terminal domain-containing protein n=1 Tax=Candidatus Laterigemmans baculatus TaxID=2770505 RepID=UPI0013DB05C0|nr:ParB N-terminal domain-containing protein [Candidatus Laterigemmans baculatus]